MGPFFHSPLEHSARFETLAEDECQLWRCQLDLSDEVTQSFWQTLSPQEHSRAQAFRFAQLRSRYIVGRGMLRKILGQYLQQSPAEVPLSARLPGGKPELEGS